MPKKKFLRRNTKDYSRLGKLRKKLQKWRKPKGRDNKMRLKEKGRPPVVSVGYKKPEKLRNKVEGKEIKTVFNTEDLNKIEKNQIVLIGKIGKKKKMEIIKMAEEKKIEIINKKINEKPKKAK